MRWFFAACLVICLSLPATAQRPKPKLDPLQRAKAATALVSIDSFGVGTAFCIRAKDGLFLTNRHVMRIADSSSEIELVLNPAESNQNIVRAQVVKLGEDMDLALLKVGPDQDLTELPLGSDAQLQETAPVTAFGYPFGQLLATEGEQYPSISVNTARISALRKKAGKLDSIQIDGTINPGNSGGPLLDAAGKVIGVNTSAVLTRGIAFAIPVSHVQAFLKQPFYTIDVPNRSFSQASEKQTLQIGAVQFFGEKVATPPRLELVLKSGKKDERTFPAQVVAGKYQVSAALLPPRKAPLVLRLFLETETETIPCETEDRDVVLGGKSTRLVSLRQIQLDKGKHKVTRWGAEPVETAISGLGPLKSLDGRDVDPLTARVVDIFPTTRVPQIVEYEMKVHSAGAKEPEIHKGTLFFPDAPWPFLHPHDPRDPRGRPVRDLVIETRIDGTSTLRITPWGLYWSHQQYQRPGITDATGTYTLVNGHRWKTDWQTGGPTDSAAGESYLFPILLERGFHEPSVLSCRVQPGDPETPDRIKVRRNTYLYYGTFREGVAFDDGEPGSVLCKVLLRHTGSTAAAATRPEGPRGGRWTFDEPEGLQLADSSGHGHHGRLGSPGPVAGRMGKGLGLEYGRVEFKDAFDFDARKPFTVAAWTWCDAPDTLPLLRNTGPAPNRTGFSIERVSDQFFVQLKGASENNALGLTLGRKVPLHAWHHLAVTYDGSGKAAGMRIYLDGAAGQATVARDALSDSIVSKAPFRLGGDEATWIGRFDDVRIYRRALPAAEVLEVSRLTAPEPQASPLKKDLAAHWTFDNDPAGKVIGLAEPGVVIPGRDVAKRLPGKFGAGLRLDRAAAVIDTAGDFDTDDAFSVGLWVRRDGNAGKVALLSKLDPAPPYAGWELTEVDGRILVTLSNAWRGSSANSSLLEISSESAISAGDWHHVSFTYDGGGEPDGLHLYLDGQLARTAITQNSLQGSIRSPVGLRLGSRTSQLRFTGVLDELAIYDRELSSQDVKDLVTGKPPAFDVKE